MQPSLLRQLLVWIVLPLIPLVLINGWLASSNARASADRAFDRTLQASARSIAERVTVEGGELVVDIPVAALEMFDPNFQDRVFYRVGFAGASTITGYHDLPLPSPLPASGELAFYDTHYRGESLRVAAYSFPLYYGGAHRQMLVQVGETTSARQALALQLQRDSLLQQLLLALAVVLFTSIGIHQVLRPLREVGRTLNERGGDPALRLDENAVQSELQPLARALNQTLEKLEEQLDARQRFVADAAHQLRTPLTLLKTQAELTAREPDGARRDEGLAALVRSTDQAIRLANQLLALSRAEPWQAQQPAAPFDLARLAREVCGDFIATALAKQIDLGYEGAEHAQLSGQPLLLRELMSNLIDNAIRYSPVGGVVTVAVGPGDAGWCLSVQDNGPGIPVAERQRVFERFYRGEHVSDNEGCGLGLAIVAEIARVHGADVTLNEPPGGGLLVALTLPAAS
ncbi:sensor histidine kinase N-terminal domain-containing protein [Neisseriaceae bacterium JH1-16]|nr:sensor histidine kinase N-terminal domain-containing protein [Neisseriaceae bacterium JH1-16]